MMKYADLFLLILGQLLRFLIWSLCLLNFMKSASSLVVSGGFRASIGAISVVMYSGVLFYVVFGITLVVMNDAYS